MEDKETFIRTTMNSLDGIHRASPARDFYEGFIPSPGIWLRSSRRLTPGFIWQVAAGLALLVSLNVAIIAYYYHSGTHVTTIQPPAANEYVAYLETINL